ncbi:7TM-DISM domain-containing protein, partial [Arthrospira platensis SPKY1]|nr:7TM-DISM domain-containing protein [Arthrospira platensis SPKY1]
MLEERTARLTPEQALALARDGSFVQSSERVPKFGIGSHPVWLHLRLYNPQEETLQRTLMLGVPWLDRMDVHVLHLDRVIQHLVAGDAHPDFIRPLGSIGYAVGLELKPGISELLIRVESVDPLAIPLRLLDAEATGDRVRWHHFGYGLLYGFLLALIGYNTMLYFGLRKGGHLDYALYLGCFLATSLAYSGNGYAWIWGGHS